MDIKTCSRCGEEKTIDEYRPRNNQCRRCEREAARERRDAMTPQQRKDKLAKDRARKKQWRDANPEKHERQKLRKNRRMLAERIKRNRQTLREAAQAAQHDIDRCGRVGLAWNECWYMDKTNAEQRLARDLPRYLELVAMDLRSEDERKGINRISYDDSLAEIVGGLADHMVAKCRQRTVEDHSQVLEALNHELPDEPDTQFDMTDPAR
ncbi:MAG: hypothetical protein AAF438_05530 [Pseudomonadota bacterium]